MGKFKKSKYHDKEWENPHYNDEYMFGFLMLESLQAGFILKTYFNLRKNLTIRTITK